VRLLKSRSVHLVEAHLVVVPVVELRSVLSIAASKQRRPAFADDAAKNRADIVVI
jgi:hypothetical protein